MANRKNTLRVASLEGLTVVIELGKARPIGGKSRGYRATATVVFERGLERVVLLDPNRVLERA